MTTVDDALNEYRNSIDDKPLSEYFQLLDMGNEIRLVAVSPTLNYLLLKNLGTLFQAAGLECRASGKPASGEERKGRGYGKRGYQWTFSFEATRPEFRKIWSHLTARTDGVRELLELHRTLHSLGRQLGALGDNWSTLRIEASRESDSW